MKRYHFLKKFFAFLVLSCLLFSGSDTLAASKDVTVEETSTEEISTEEETSSEAETETDNNTQSMQLSATVSSAKASYYVEVPAEISFGAIHTTKDTTCSYEVKVTGDFLSDKEYVTVSSIESFPLTHMQNHSSFPCYNDFPSHTFTQSESAGSTLTILKEDAASAAKGSYHGTLQFHITYGKTPVENTQEAFTVKTDAKIAGAYVKGLTSYTSGHKEGRYIFTIQNADSIKHQSGIAAIASLISAGAQSGTTSYYDFSFQCDTGKEIKDITDTEDTVLEICIPISKTQSGNITAYRCHNAGTSLMQLLSKRPTTQFVDNTYYYDAAGGYLYFYTSKFSVFAAHQTPAATTTQTSQTSSASSSILDVEEETAFTAKVSFRKSSDFDSTSMCNPLFYEQADLKVNKDNTQLTLYVIDPIPNYTSEGTPLSNISFFYQGTSYLASIDTSGKVAKSYPAASGFISTAGNYESSKITVTLPTDAIKASADKALTCSAYVNAVMKTTQTFYVVLTDFTKGTSATASTVTTTASTVKTDVKPTAVTTPAVQTDTALSQTPVTSTDQKSSSKKSSSVKSAGKKEETDIEEETVPLAETIPEQAHEISQHNSTEGTPQTDGYLLVTDAGIYSIAYLLVTCLVCLGAYLITRMKLLRNH